MTLIFQAAVRCWSCPGCDYRPDAKNFTPIHCGKCGHITCQEKAPFQAVTAVTEAEDWS